MTFKCHSRSLEVYADIRGGSLESGRQIRVGPTSNINDIERATN